MKDHKEMKDHMKDYVKDHKEMKGTCRIGEESQQNEAYCFESCFNEENKGSHEGSHEDQIPRKW